MRSPQLIKLSLCLLAALLLAGCGQYGNLYLPEPAEVKEPASSPTAEATSTPEAESSAEN